MSTQSITIREMLSALDALAFKESEHPRDKAGQFAGSTASTASTAASALNKFADQHDLIAEMPARKNFRQQSASAIDAYQDKLEALHGSLEKYKGPKEPETKTTAGPLSKVPTLESAMEKSGMVYSGTLPNGELKFKKGDLRVYIDPADNYSFKAKSKSGDKLGTGSALDLLDWLKINAAEPF